MVVYQRNLAQGPPGAMEPHVLNQPIKTNTQDTTDMIEGMQITCKGISSRKVLRCRIIDLVTSEFALAITRQMIGIHIGTV